MANNDSTILNRSQNPNVATVEDDDIEFVQIPHDTDKPMRRMMLPKFSSSFEGVGDRLPDFVKRHFADSRTVDEQLMQEQAKKMIASASKEVQDLAQEPGARQNISSVNLNAIAVEGSVETFPLVRPASTNSYQGVYIYMDELGMLKKLPLNPRASALAQLCRRGSAATSFNFYGDVFVGRVQTKPVVKNVDFRLDVDTDGRAEWLQRAPFENEEWQEAVKSIQVQSENKNKIQANEKNKGDKGGDGDGDVSLTWEQNEDELEIRIPFPNVDVLDKSKVHVRFLSNAIHIQYGGVDFLSLQPLYNGIQAGDGGCTWSLDGPNTLVVTVEVTDPNAAWPQLILSPS